MKTISAVFDNLKAGEKKTIAVGAAADYDVLGAVRNAYDEGIANAILVGQESAIKKVAAENNIDIAPFKIVNVEGDVEAARTAVKMVHDGEADLSMKGMVQSPDFLRAVLDKEIGLRREGSTIGSVAVMEGPTVDRLLFLTDAALTPQPDLATKVLLINNAVEIARMFEIDVPKVAALAGSEALNPKIPTSAEGRVLQEMNEKGEIKDCIVCGPISLDLAISEESARHKGVTHPVAGHADVLLCPDIAAANILYKSMKLFGGFKSGGVLMGGTSPIIFTSRSDDAETKLNTIAFCVYLAQKA